MMTFQQLVDACPGGGLRRSQMAEGKLACLLVDSGLDLPEYEYVFAPPRRWRFDFAWVEHKLAVEIEGGTWVRGRHNRGAGYEQDCEKYNQAVLLGWRVLRFTPQMVRDDWDGVREVLETALRHR